MKEFAEKVRENIISTLGDGYDVGVIEKNGRTGICIKASDMNIAPVIYVNDFRKNNKSVEETAKHVIDIYNEHKDCGGLTADSVASKLQDWEYVTENLEIRLLPNTFKADVFVSADKFGFDDLILVPYIRLGEQNGQILATQVRKELLDMWEDADTEDLVNIGLVNAKHEARFDNAWEYIFDVITNNHGMYGAVSAIAMRDELKKKYPNGYYVIPSSVHEVIVFSKEMPVTDIDDMVKVVNKTSLAEAEVLSDHAYLIGA